MMNELKEIRASLDSVYGWAEAFICKCDPGVNSVCDRCVILDQLHSAQTALSRIEAREAEAPKDAHEVADYIWRKCVTGSDFDGIDFEHDEAAAEIERYVRRRIAEAKGGQMM